MATKKGAGGEPQEYDTSTGQYGSGKTFRQNTPHHVISREMDARNYNASIALQTKRNAKTQRTLALGMRRPASHVLSDEEIEKIKAEARSIGIDEKILRFNTGNQTCFLEQEGVIEICGDILPDETSKIARDAMSIRAVLAHEHYGHYMSHPSKYSANDWRDEFQASYTAAIKAPNLSREDRSYLMIDAYDRAREAGVYIAYDEKAKEIIYGY